MEPVDLHQFVKDLKLNRMVTQKQCTVIDNLFIYFNDLKVYKVVIQANPLMMKKAKKLGIDREYVTIFMDDIPIKVDTTYSALADKELHVEHGKYIAIYNPNTADCGIYHGEESEEDQLRNLTS